MFKPVLSSQVENILIKLSKKDKKLVLELNKKIKQICMFDSELIEHYKNLRNDFSNYKRVHIGRSFVLLFHVDFKFEKIYFYKFDHHDKIYK
ncbi:addiction module toxin RelE [bacterium]|nr:addiction module toxin RelE [Candidatus ainarchaeum sp.]MDD3976023.1 addiction module toxin RelE [Candidatus ainarchaeum sp.]NCC71718.1 addiction module toxin RelE [bacterium]